MWSYPALVYLLGYLVLWIPIRVGLVIWHTGHFPGGPTHYRAGTCSSWIYIYIYIYICVCSKWWWAAWTKKMPGPIFLSQSSPDPYGRLEMNLRRIFGLSWGLRLLWSRLVEVLLWGFTCMRCASSFRRSSLRVLNREVCGACEPGETESCLPMRCPSAVTVHQPVQRGETGWFFFCYKFLAITILGPVQLQTPDEFKSSNGLRFFQLNVRSLVNKMDLRIWVDSTNYNIIVLSDTWLNKSVLDSIIHIDGYNVFRSAHTKEGGGIAVYIKSKLNCTCILSISKPKCFELLAIKLLFKRSWYHCCQMLSSTFSFKWSYHFTYGSSP